jgi:hypothetical protein
MAGSYLHAVTNSGKLRRSQDIGIAVENLGDAYETLEEFYGMVWFLAGGDAEKVEEARLRYREGLTMSPGQQK